MKEIDELRVLYHEKGYNFTQIEAATGHTRKTVSKYINKEDWNIEISKSTREVKIDKYKNDIDTWLTDDLRMKKKQRHTATRVFSRLQEKYNNDFNCSYRTVSIYVAQKKKDLFKRENGFIPLNHILGEAQVDFGKAAFIESGVKYSGSYLVVSFPSSNAGFMQLFKGENTECLFEGLKNIFNHIGGVPTKLWFDNMSTVVVSIKKDGEREVTDSFYRFKQHYGFSATFCNPNSGNEKGNVECKVGYHRRNLLVPIPEFNSLQEYNKTLLCQCDQDHQRSHYAKNRSISDLFTEDKKSLLILPEKEFMTYKYENVQTNGYGKFTLNKGLYTYSSSPKFANEMIAVKVTAYEVIPLDEQFKEIVIHHRLYGDTEQERMDWLPYLTQLSRKPRALKYSGIFEMFPENVKELFNNKDIQNHSELLKVLADITCKSSFETGIKVLENAIKYNKYDTESLNAIFNRINLPIAELPELKLPGNTPKLAATDIDLSVYDKLFIEEVRNPC